MATGESILELGWKLWAEAVDVAVFVKRRPVVSDINAISEVAIVAKTRQGQPIARVNAKSYDELQSKLQQMLTPMPKTQS
jgi:hypothetical protein